MRKGGWRGRSCDDDARVVLSKSSSSFPEPQFLPSYSLPQYDVEVKELNVWMQGKNDWRGSRSKHILNGVALKVPRGRMHMILGLNGSGKVCSLFWTR